MGMSLFTPEEEEDQDKPQPGSAAMLLPPGGGQQPQQSPVPYLVSSQGSANPAQPQQMQQMPPQEAIPAPSTPPPPQIFLPPVATPPGMTPDYKLALDKRTADAAPIDPKANGPKWWERIGGALVGGATAWGSGAEAGIRAGSAITNQRMTAAQDKQRSTLTADDVAIENYEKAHGKDVQAYELQHQNWGDQEAQAGRQQQQANADRTFGRETENDTFNQNRDRSNDQRGQANADRSFEFEKQVHGDQQNQLGKTNGFEGRRLSIEQQRADQDKVTGDSPLSKLTANQKRQEDERHDLEYKQQQDSYLKAKRDGDENAEADNTAARNNLQTRWNQRYSEIYPNGRPSSQPGTPQAPAAPSAQPPPAANPTTPPPAAGQKAVSLKAAMALPMNKGKSSQQVTQDLKSRQYKVLP